MTKFCAYLMLMSLHILTVQADDAKVERATKLFNGRNIEGWRIISQDPAKAENLFQVTDGIIHAYPEAPDGTKQPFGYLVTLAEYSNFRLSLQYKWGTKKFRPRAERDSVRDAGVAFHVRGPDDVWPAMVECQIQEGDTGDAWIVHTQATSTVHPTDLNYAPDTKGGVEQTKGAQPGEYHRFLRSYCHEQAGWNQVELVVCGESATYSVNGHIVNQLTRLKAWNSATGSWEPLTRGEILLQAEGAEVFYRNITITPLEAAHPDMKQ